MYKKDLENDALKKVFKLKFSSDGFYLFNAQSQKKGKYLLLTIRQVVVQ